MSASAPLTDDLSITCPCGHTGPLGTFEQDAAYHYACPACGFAWHLEAVAPGRYDENGMWWPAKVRVVTTGGARPTPRSTR